jgi:hypothetical protein
MKCIFAISFLCGSKAWSNFHLNQEYNGEKIASSIHQIIDIHNYEQEEATLNITINDVCMFRMRTSQKAVTNQSDIPHSCQYLNSSRFTRPSLGPFIISCTIKKRYMLA